MDSEGSNDVGHDNDTDNDNDAEYMNAINVGITPLQLAFRFNKYDMCMPQLVIVLTY